MSRKLRKEQRQRERESEPPSPLHPDSTDPGDDEPHHGLANPASSPDETEFPDPFERRPDPRSPDVEDDAAKPRAPSTSEPHPPRNYDDLKPVKGDS